MEYLKRTDNVEEMIQIGRRIAEEKKELYTPIMMKKMWEGVESHIPNASESDKWDMVYRAIYDWWAFGANVDEEFYYHFYKKTCAEKDEYMVTNIRSVYVRHLNSDGDPHVKQMLLDKYLVYQRLKPYYLRDVIQICGEEDYPIFSEFVAKHPVFVIKPSDFWYGIGVKKVSLSEYNNDPSVAFQSILGEGKAIKEQHQSRQGKMVIEELIVQDEALARLHPESVNAIRATAVRGKDGRIHLYHPWIKVGMHGAFVASAVFNGFDAEVDSETGIVISDGYQENGNVFPVHPESGIPIKGFQVPKWDELIQIVDELMSFMPEYGYIGWDMVLTPKGWCVMEGNYSGEFMFQLLNGRGYKKEFEDLIGWKFEKEYWWQA